jgi:hypothetical protein
LIEKFTGENMSRILISKILDAKLGRLLSATIQQAGNQFGAGFEATKNGIYARLPYSLKIH